MGKSEKAQLPGQGIPLQLGGWYEREALGRPLAMPFSFVGSYH